MNEDDTDYHVIPYREWEPDSDDDYPEETDHHVIPNRTYVYELEAYRYSEDADPETLPLYGTFHVLNIIPDETQDFQYGMFMIISDNDEAAEHMRNLIKQGGTNLGIILIKLENEMDEEAKPPES